jgi:hypothetical protein
MQWFFTLSCGNCGPAVVNGCATSISARIVQCDVGKFGEACNTAVQSLGAPGVEFEVISQGTVCVGLAAHLRKAAAG